jgi:hypothetical protein
LIQEPNISWDDKQRRDTWIEPNIFLPVAPGHGLKIQTLDVNIQSREVERCG